MYISRYAAVRLNGARPSQKMIDRFQGARLSRDTGFLSDDPRRYHRPLAYARDKRVIDEVCYTNGFQEACINSPILSEILAALPSRSAQIIRRVEGMRVIMIRDVDSIRLA